MINMRFDDIEQIEQLLKRFKASLLKLENVDGIDPSKLNEFNKLAVYTEQRLPILIIRAHVKPYQTSSLFVRKIISLLC